MTSVKKKKQTVLTRTKRTSIIIIHSNVLNRLNLHCKIFFYPVYIIKKITLLILVLNQLCLVNQTHATLSRWTHFCCMEGLYQSAI